VFIFGVHLISKKGFLASKFLGLYFLTYALRIFSAYITTGGRLVEYPEFFLVFSPVQFLHAPFGFLFVYFILYPTRKLTWWHAALFIPFTLHFIELLPYYFGPYENKVREVHLVMKYKSLIHYPGKATYFTPAILSLIKIIFSTVLAFASFLVVLFYIQLNTLVAYKQNTFLLNWLLAFCILSLISAFFVIAYWLGIIGFNNLRFSYADLLMHLSAFVNIGFVLYRPTLLDGVSFHSLVTRLHAQDRNPELWESAAKLEKYVTYASELEKAFSTEQLFLASDLTLEKAGQLLGIKPKDLSRTSQYIYNLSFPDFVNSWRIAFIVDKQKHDEVWRSYSQEVLAELSGFGSRQSLNNATNRLHNLTSTRYFAQELQKEA
jgi:AraC-like DNA-binding protein